jgi:2-oxoglutarate dehydrogenase complex dehydrogenase (E1) component-like enzyme
MVGEAMSWGDPSAQQYWSLVEVIDRMQAAYCGTLTAEYDHLHSRWVALPLPKAP